MEAETALKIIGRRVSGGSATYTDCFRAYLGLGEAGYHYETVNHSAGEWVDEATLTAVKTGLPSSGLGLSSTEGRAR